MALPSPIPGLPMTPDGQPDRAGIVAMALKALSELMGDLENIRVEQAKQRRLLALVAERVGLPRDIIKETLK